MASIVSLDFRSRLTRGRILSALYPLIFLHVLFFSASACIAHRDCAEGDPTCSNSGTFALLSVLPKSAFLVGTNQGQIASSSDGGSTWKVTQLSDLSFFVQGFGKGPGYVVAFGTDGSATGAFYVSWNLETWEGPFVLAGVSSLTQGGGDGVTVYAQEPGSSNYYRLDPDGGFSNIAALGSGNGGIQMFQFVSGTWFAGDTPPDSTMFFGSDPTSLIGASTPPTDTISDLIFLNGNYLGVGPIDTFVTAGGSLDTWSPLGFVTILTGICENGFIGVASGPAGQIYTTLDAQSFNETSGNGIDTGLGVNLSDVACFGDSFVVIPVTSGNWVFSQNSGITWTTISNPVGSGTPLSIGHFSL